MAAPTPEIANNVFVLDILHIKPKFMLPMMQYIQDGKALIEKHGAKIHALWIPEAGAAHSIVALLEYSGMDARSKAMGEMYSDPEWLAHRKIISRFINCHDNYVCKANPFSPKREINPKGKYMIQTFHAKSMPVFAAWKLVQINEMLEKKYGADMAHAALLLHPIASLENSMILIREVPDNQLDRTFNNWGKAMFDMHNWLDMADAHGHYERTRNILVMPIPWDKIPPKTSLEQIFAKLPF